MQDRKRGWHAFIARERRAALRLACAAAALPFVLLAAYRFIDPPFTPLMAIRWGEGAAIDRRGVPLNDVAPALARNVVAAEDNRFCVHYGVDFSAIQEAIEEHQEGRRLRGASTITMQVARNLFLWPGGGWPRKAVEAAFAVAIDALWPKRRIMEVYLNVAEWGPGVFGAEAAARHHFGKPAAALNAREAGLLAAILPSPLHWTVQGDYVRQRAAIIEDRVEKLGPLLACVR